MKAADITPTFKNEDSLNKENYRPVSVILTIFKIFEKALFDQLTKFSNKFLSLLWRGFRKGKWKKSLDEPDGIVGTLLIDHSKAYDCVNHELILLNKQHAA